MLITVFGPPPGTIHGGVHTDIPISVTPTIRGTPDGIVPGITAGMIPGIPAGTIPGITDTADMAGTTTIGIHGIITDTTPDRDILTTTIRMLLTGNALQLTARVTAILGAQLHPVAPHTPGGAKAEVLTAITQAEYIQVHVALPDQEAAPSINAVPAALHAVPVV